MPRIRTKRCKNWGTGPIGMRADKSLARVERSEKWRKNRNKRKQGIRVF
jgi:hypothetical protein